MKNAWHEFRVKAYDNLAIDHAGELVYLAPDAGEFGLDRRALAGNKIHGRRAKTWLLEWRRRLDFRRGISAGMRLDCRLKLAQGDARGRRRITQATRYCRHKLAHADELQLRPQPRHSTAQRVGFSSFVLAMRGNSRWRRVSRRAARRPGPISSFEPWAKVRGARCQVSQPNTSDDGDGQHQDEFLAVGRRESSETAAACSCESWSKVQNAVHARVSLTS